MAVSCFIVGFFVFSLLPMPISTDIEEDIFEFVVDIVIEYATDGQEDNKDFELLEKRIDQSSEKTIQAINGQIQASKIDDAVRAIRNSLEDLDDFLEATEQKEFYKNTFLDNSKLAINAAKGLPSLIGGKLPLSDKTFFQVFAEQKCCDAAAIKNFQTFYKNQTANGVIIDVYVKAIQSVTDIESVIKKTWQGYLDELEDHYHEQYGLCINNKGREICSSSSVDGTVIGRQPWLITISSVMFSLFKTFILEKL